MIKSAFWHSLLGHPIMAALDLVGLRSTATYVHDRLFAFPDRAEWHGQL